MESKRQLQIASIVKRNISELLQQEDIYFYGSTPFVPVTDVKMTSDLGIAKIYLSVFNVKDEEQVVKQLCKNMKRVKHVMGRKLARHIRKMPNYAFYVDDMLDAMEHVDKIFNDLD